MLHAVQELGTVWSTIASSYFPNRTPLALKNRYSALCRGPRSSGQSVLFSGDGLSTWDLCSNEEDDAVSKAGDCNRDQDADGRRPDTSNNLYQENQFPSSTGFARMQSSSQGGLQSPTRSSVESRRYSIVHHLLQ